MKDGGVARRGSGPEVFAYADLIRDARLKPPMVLDIYQELASRGIAPISRPPRNILDLCDLLQPQAGGKDRERGKIYICDVDGADEERVLALMERIDDVCFKGAMGTSAKLMAESCGIPLDFTYGVIDKSILKAFIGKDALIMTSGGMVGHTIERISEYGRESGASIEAVRLSL
jgi:cobalt/nickel transport system ATP-binding protein